MADDKVDRSVAEIAHTVEQDERSTRWNHELLDALSGTPGDFVPERFVLLWHAVYVRSQKIVRSVPVRGKHGKLHPNPREPRTIQNGPI